MGEHRTKTISAWSILIRAKAAQNIPLPTWAEIDTQLAVVKANLRARTVYQIVHTMRSTTTGDWKSIALSWWNSTTRREPRVAAEIAKILLADENLHKAPNAALVAASERVLGIAKITYKEWWSATRMLLVNRKNAGQPLNFQQHYQDGLSKCRPEQIVWMKHGMANTLWKLGEKEAGVLMLRENVQSLEAAHPLYAVSNLVLARMEVASNQPARAAKIYLDLFKEGKVKQPQRFNAFAQWTNLPNDLTPDQSAQIQSKAISLVKETTDYKAVLTMALVCIDRPGMLREVGFTSMDHGEKLALKAISTAQTARQAAIPLFHLTRRRHDYGRQGKVVDQWRSFSNDYKAWLQSDSAEFWDYLSYVFRCLWAEGFEDEASALALRYTNDSSIPSGAALISALYGLKLIGKDRVGDAFIYFTKAGNQGEGSPPIAYAHYWLGLRSYRHGDHASCRRSMELCRRILGTKMGTGWQKKLQSRSFAAQSLADPALLNGMDDKSLEQIGAELSSVQTDLNRI